MARKLAWLALVVALAVPVFASAFPGAISGKVSNSAGIAQMGVTVEVFGAASVLPVAKVFTDVRGNFVARELPAGSYYVKVSAPSFLPVVREDVAVRSGAILALSITLNTLFEAIEMMPLRGRLPADQDDWKWTLRSASNRPILRILDNDGPLVITSKGEKDEDKALKARVSFVAGSEGSGFGNTPDVNTTVNFETSIFSFGRLALDGNFGYTPVASEPGTVLRASYSHHMADGSEPQITVTSRRFGTPAMLTHSSDFEALAISASDNLSLLDFIDLNLGSEYQSIQYMGHVSAARPFARADLHLSPDTVLEYRYDSSVPNTRSLKGFDSAPADFSESGPRMSLANFTPRLEQAQHNEVSLSRRFGENKLQLGWYSDRIGNPALSGVGMMSPDSGDVMTDFYSGTFTYAGRNLDTSGVRAVMQRTIYSGITATVDYGYGGVLALSQSNPSWAELRSDFATERRHAVACMLSGVTPISHTKWLASYRWTNGAAALTPVDQFNVSPGQSDPYLSIFLRQPIPGMGFIPGHVEALVDVRNLLAQGYVPVMGPDGRTVYLVQSARTIRGGIAFTF
jgi:hypothetical protein